MDITVVVTYPKDYELKATGINTQMMIISRMRAVRALEAVVASTCKEKISTPPLLLISTPLFSKFLSQEKSNLWTKTILHAEDIANHKDVCHKCHAGMNFMFKINSWATTSVHTLEYRGLQHSVQVSVELVHYGCIGLTWTFGLILKCHSRRLKLNPFYQSEWRKGKRSSFSFLET